MPRLQPLHELAQGLVRAAQARTEPRMLHDSEDLVGLTWSSSLYRVTVTVSLSKVIVGTPNGRRVFNMMLVKDGVDLATYLREEVGKVEGTVDQEENEPTGISPHTVDRLLTFGELVHSHFKVGSSETRQQALALSYELETELPEGPYRESVLNLRSLLRDAKDIH